MKVIFHHPKKLFITISNQLQTKDVIAILRQCYKQFKFRDEELLIFDLDLKKFLLLLQEHGIDYEQSENGRIKSSRILIYPKEKYYQVTSDDDSINVVALVKSAKEVGKYDLLDFGDALIQKYPANKDFIRDLLLEIGEEKVYFTKNEVLSLEKKVKSYLRLYDKFVVNISRKVLAVI